MFGNKRKQASYMSAGEESVRSHGKSSIYKGSTEYFEKNCDPCSTVGECFEAQGFCSDCEEYLCITCYTSHSRGRATRNHSLLDKDNMPKESFKICDPCKTADEEINAVGYCADCDEYLCGNCYKSHARSKATKTHNLMDKDNMPNLISSAAKMTIDARSASNETEEFIHIQDINVKVSSDLKECYITGIAQLSNRKLILADQYNESLKLVDIEYNMVRDIMRLQSLPLGISKLSPEMVAVVLYEVCMIQLVSVSGRRLSAVRTIKTDGYSTNLECVNSKLYVAFEKPLKVQVLEPTGIVRMSIKPDSDVQKLLNTPRSIAVEADESSIYMTDWESKKVICIDKKGNMKYMCELDNPYGIVIYSGYVYISNRNQHALCKMTSDLKEPIIILGRGDGLVMPNALCLDAEEHVLYISSGSTEAKDRNHIKVYKLK